MLALSSLDMVLMLLVMADVLLLLLLRCANNEMMNDVALRSRSYQEYAIKPCQRERQLRNIYSNVCLGNT